MQVPQKLSIAIVITTHNELDYLKKCLDSVFASTYDNYTIYLVDDGSQDGTSEYVKKNFPSIRILKGDGSLWWGGAVNKALKVILREKCTHICLLNSDNVIAPQTIEWLVQDAIKNPGCVIAAKVYDIHNPNILIHAGACVDWKRGAMYFYGEGEEDRGQWDGMHCVNYIGGMGVFFPREIIEDIGFLDAKNFPMGGDREYSMRVVTSGYKILVSLRAKVWTWREHTSHNKVPGIGLLSKYFIGLFSIRGFRNIRRNVIFAWRYAPKRYMVSWLLSIYITNPIRKFLRISLMRRKR